MSAAGLLVPDRYQDSVRLMRITEALRTREGIRAAGVIATTPANLELLRAGGLWFPDLDRATANDIAIAVDAVDPAAADAAISAGRELLDAAASGSGRTAYATVASALADAPAATVGFVAVPGEHAPAEAGAIIAAGRSVVIFSDNVPLAEERALKEEAHRRGQLVMGPDAGTVLLGGLGLGFANAVPVGRIGIVAASGTGAQAVSALLAQAGEGVTAIVGLGSHDPSDEIGGISLFDALDALDADEATEVVVLVAKTIGPRTRERLLRRLARMTKPVVSLVPGWSDGWVTRVVGAHPAYTFAEAAERARELLERAATPPPAWTRLELAPARRDGGRIVGLFAGGTLAQEAAASLRALLGTGKGAAPGPIVEVVDLGADEYTRGRPHPMIAPSLTAEAIVHAAGDPETDTILFDVVLGYGAHLDPASALAPAVEQARRASTGSSPLLCIAVLCGSDDDPQGRRDTAARLSAAGAVVVDDPASAAAIAVMRRFPEDRDAASTARWSIERPEAVVTVGTDWFCEPLESQGASVLHVDWRPPAGGDDELNALLARLT